MVKFSSFSSLLLNFYRVYSLSARRPIGGVWRVTCGIVVCDNMNTSFYSTHSWTDLRGTLFGVECKT